MEPEPQDPNAQADRRAARPSAIRRSRTFRLYFTNLYRRKILRTKIVAPYALIFYATHKCNLACSYCTQKEPDVFSDELDHERHAAASAA